MIYFLSGIAVYFLLYFVVSVIFVAKIINHYGYLMFLLFIIRPLLLLLLNILVLYLYYGFFIKNKKKLNKIILFLIFLIITISLGIYKDSNLPKPNKYNIIAFKPNSKQTVDFTHDKRADNYPICTFQYNSLGFRDIEPDLLAKGKHKILVIGDSFIWGAGIATNKQTIAALLRNKLNKLAPQKYEVISAAVPALSMYGYFDILKKLKPHLNPDLILIGYLADADFDPFDFVTLSNKLPANIFLKNLILNLHILHLIREVSLTYAKNFWISQECVNNIKKLFQQLATYSQKQKVDIVLIKYFRGKVKVKIPKVINVFEVPDYLKYPGKRNKYWYAKDFHPKPPLNNILAEMLAKKIIIYFEKGDKIMLPSFNQKNHSAKKINKLSKNKDVKVRATMIKKDVLTYQIIINFDKPMKYSYSYLSFYKGIDHFWNNEYKFNIIIKTEKEINNLELTINPDGYKSFFITKDNKKLPKQEIIVRIYKDK